LVSYGYKVFNYNEIMSDRSISIGWFNEGIAWKRYTKSNNDSNLFTRSISETNNNILDLNSLINYQSRKRKMNLEEDPFGEEDWGYVQERIDVGELKIGDRVEHDCGSVGTITAKSIRLVGVVWDNGEQGVYTGKTIKKIEDNRKRKLNLENDPFGEENWFEE